MRCRRAVAMIVVVLGLLLRATVASHVSVNVDNSTGAFTLLLDGETWLNSDSVMFRSDGSAHTTQDGTLKLVSSHSFDGVDSSGRFNATELVWGSSDGNTFVTTILQYEQFVLFRQAFPKGAHNTQTGNKDSVISSFPSFKVEALGTARRGCLSYFGAMAGANALTSEWRQGGVVAGGLAAGPYILFSEDLKTSTVISAASNFMAASHYYDSQKSVLRHGVMGNVTSVPVGFQVDTIVYASVAGGVNNAALEWGAVLRNMYGRPADIPDSDFTCTHLSYSTDNGAYYYYHTEANDTYEKTMLDVKAYSETAKIPYRTVLLDSWWYFKGVGDGVKEWLPMPSIFPHGMQYVFNNTKWPITGHNRYWAADTVYAKQNGGSWDFIVEGKLALPTEQKFWDWLMASSRQWGLRVYEQDWLYTEFEGLPSLTQNATLGRMWLMQMGTAAQRNGLNIQYCMSYPRHILQALEIPAVSQARASGDYHSDQTNQWNIGTTSLFLHALGIAPSKDNYWSTAVQKGNPYDDGRAEPFRRLQSAVSTFSRGPVAPSDKIGLSDRDLILRGCMSDGTLLRPDRPATAIDAQFLQSALHTGGPQGQVWSSMSTPAGRRNAHVLAIELQQPFDLVPADLGYTEADKLVAWEANLTSAVAVFSSASPIQLKVCGKIDFQLYHVSPIETNGWSVLGETSKWVPTSKDRIVDISATPTSLRVLIRGDVGESVSLAFLQPGAKLPQQHMCTVTSSSAATFLVDISTPSPTFSCV